MGKLKCARYVIRKIICLLFALSSTALDEKNKDTTLENVGWKSVTIVMNGETSVRAV